MGKSIRIRDHNGGHSPLLSPLQILRVFTVESVSHFECSVYVREWCNLEAAIFSICLFVGCMFEWRHNKTAILTVIWTWSVLVHLYKTRTSWATDEFRCFISVFPFACALRVCVMFVCVCVRLCYSSSVLFVCSFFLFSFFSLQYKRGTVSIGAEKNLYLLSYSFRTGSHYLTWLQSTERDGSGSRSDRYFGLFF